MRTSDAGNGLRVATILILILAASNRSVESSEIMSSIIYSTTGAVESGGVVGTPVVSFQGVGDGTLTTGGTLFDLGRFVMAPLPAGASTTFQDTPFEVTFLAKSLDGVAMDGVKPVVIQGWLDGTVTGAGSSNVLAHFDGRPGLPGDDGAPHIYPSIVAPFMLGNLKDYLDQAGRFGILSADGSTSFQGVIYSEVVPKPGSPTIPPPQIAPEPSTFVLFAASAGLLILVHVRRARVVR